MKKLLTVAAAAAFAAGIGFASAPAASACGSGTSGNAGNTVLTLPDGGIIYANGDGSAAGISGDHGYIEAGTAGSQGSSNDAPIDGSVTAAPSACLAGTTII